LLVYQTLSFRVFEYGVARLPASSRIFVMAPVTLDALDLAALLCSRVCHDVISPVGAIINGLEMLEDEKDPDMRAVALELVKKSATTASARLQFCRLAFGAAGSAGASIDTGDAEKVTRGLIGEGKISLQWEGVRQLMPKNKVKVILNLCLIAMACIPRGGVVSVAIEGQGDAASFTVAARGANARLASSVPAALECAPESGSVDAHAIQPFYTGLVAKACGLSLTLKSAPDCISIAASNSAAVVDTRDLQAAAKAMADASSAADIAQSAA
jgi:histidine phosphotransferase ChpT